MVNDIYRVSIVCCYNDEKILKTMLEEGIQRQENVEIEKMFFFNLFKSAAEAYNYAIANSSSEYLIFVHQDICFLENDFVYKVINEIVKNPNAIYGLCGARKEKKRIVTYSNVYHGLQNRYMGTKTNIAVDVDGLDEIFVAFHKSIYEKIQFDDNVFDGWHLFVEDLCLQAKVKNISIKVLPFKVQHKNSLEMPKYMMVYGLYPNDYFKYLKRIRYKHKRSIEEIICPCIFISTRFTRFWKTFILMYLKMNIFRKLRRLTMK